MTRNEGTRIALPALLDVPADAYHSDAIADRPTLSKSIIHTLLEKSPAHARIAHPKLNPDYQHVDEQKYDVGTVAHQLFLEGIDRISVIQFDDWRTKAAKELRDESRAMGLTPLLAHQANEVQAMVAAVRAQCDAFPVEPALFADGVAERTIVWSEGDVVCRARLDWLRDDFRACDDLKTAGRSANPDQWCRSTMFSISAHIQAAFYGRGLRAVLGVDPEFRFCVVETEPPYAMSVIALAPSALELANAQIDYALDLWKRCLDSGEWPAYPARIAYAEAPSWEMTRWMEREAREEFTA